MQRRMLGDRSSRWLIGGVAIVAALFFCGPLLVYAAERATLSMFPTAERAFAYGSRHLESGNGYLYDIEKADIFFKKALELDEEYPYANHQRARTSFLTGDYVLAIAFINREIALYGDKHSNAYYMRGLIKGYAGLYDSAATDYKHYISLLDAPNWAAYTDYAWVLIKAERFAEAAEATERGLTVFPDNAWLLNTNAIVLYELGEYERALERARKAVDAAEKLTRREWLTAYPGNDPRVADEGLTTLRESARANMHTIESKLASSTVQ